MYNMASHGRDVGMPKDWGHQAYWLHKRKETYKYKIELVSSSTIWPKCSIPSILLPPAHHVPVGRPMKNRRVNKEEKAENALKTMVKNGKLSRNGNTVTCTICGTKGNNIRACKGPREKQENRKRNKKARTDGVADVEPTEVVVGRSQSRASQSTQEVGSQMRKIARLATKQAAV
ncbi:zinc finger, SWIM-type [Artemisia annua]|uniref:Zinc finger, SWIM-type n=1 Tax=Artemisia annua TaxID=35608 RepID=A0A2U1K8V4_ARTAN|nr:zinc finger, SWIM-type [Artemisia annua]